MQGPPPLQAAGSGQPQTPSSRGDRPLTQGSDDGGGGAPSQSQLGPAPGGPALGLRPARQEEAQQPIQPPLERHLTIHHHHLEASGHTSWPQLNPTGPGCPPFSKAPEGLRAKPHMPEGWPIPSKPHPHTPRAVSPLAQTPTSPPSRTFSELQLHKQHTPSHTHSLLVFSDPLFPRSIRAVPSLRTCPPPRPPKGRLSFLSHLRGRRWRRHHLAPHGYFLTLASPPSSQSTLLLWSSG